MTVTEAQRRKALDWHVRLFEKSPVGRAVATRVDQLLSPCMGLECLAIGGDPAMHCQLRKRGGEWTSATWPGASVELFKAVAGDDVVKLKDHVLPFEDKSMDRVVVLDGMEYLADDAAFVAECHRVLTDAGELVINVSRQKRWCWMPALRKLLGGEAPARGRRREGYTESALFEILKDGFDVDDVRVYTRFFTHVADLLGRYLAGFAVGDTGGEADDEQAPSELLEPAVYEKLYRFFAVCSPFMWCLSRLDVLLFFTRGYLVAAHAKRRIWKPRRVPRLYDGRSIAEATLRTKIGTAADF